MLADELNYFYHNIIYSLGAWMGSITATGSLIAYGKLADKLDSGALALPGRDLINIGLVSTFEKYCPFCFVFSFQYSLQACTF